MKDRGATRSGRRQQVGAWLWLFCFQFFVAEQIVRLQVRGAYSMKRNYISDLGATHCFIGAWHGATSCSPLHSLMNASFAVQGLLIAFGGLLLGSHFRGSVASRSALVLFFISGAGLLLVGLVPEDVGSSLHARGAGAHFLCGACALLLIAFSLRGWAAGATFAAGAIALGATLLLGWRDSSVWSMFDLSIGGVERAAAYPLPFWLTCVGAVLILRARITRNLAR